MKSRINSWTLVVALLASVGIVQVGAPAASAVASNTTTTIAVSDTSPSIGEIVTFTVTVTPATFTSVITGNVVVSGKGDDNGGLYELCATSNLVENPSTHVVTGTCTWKAMADHEGIKADYKGNVVSNSGYNSSRSSELPSFMAVGATNLWIPRMINGSSGNSLYAVANTAGDVTFKVDGQVISGCSNTAVSGSGTDWGVSCSYNLPNPATAFDATHLFSLNFKPTDKTMVVDQFVKPFTPDSYYLPNGDNIYQSTQGDYNNATSKTPYVNSGYVEVDHIFYKLNRSTMEAMAVGYDRFAGLTKLSFPDVLNVPSAAVPGKDSFIGSYSISTIGGWAYRLSSDDKTTHALIKEITLPSTLKVIGENAFKGQCGVTTLDIPDSVLYVGQVAFASMSTSGAGYAGCTGGETSTGLVNIKFGAGLSAIGPQIFNGDGNIRNLSFRGAPSDIKSLVQAYQTSLDMWQITNHTQNTNMYPFTGITKNSCLGNISYAGTLQVDVLATQSTAWRYWAQGCLTGTLNVQATLFKPSRPNAPVLSAATYTSATVNFNAPVSDGGDTITAYSVEYSSNNFSTWETATASLASAASPYVITGLTPSTAYRARIIARNSVGASIASQASAPLITQTPTAPGAPTANSVVLATNTSVTLAFSAPGSNGGASIESYTVTSNPDSVVAYSIGSGSGSVTMTGLRPGITYSFTAKAGNAVGSSTASNSLTLKIPKSPVLGAWANITKTKADAPFVLIPPTESYTAAGTFGYTSSNPGIVSVSGETVTVVQSGSAVITATFYPSDTATYLSGVTKTLTVTVSAQANAITFGALSSRAVNSSAFNLGATVTGGTVTYSSVTSASICTVTAGGTVSMFAPGTCVLKASSLGNASYGAAESVTQNLVITAAPPGAPALISVSVGGTDAATVTSGYATLQFTANTENGGSITSYTLTATPATGSAITSTVTAAAGTRSGTISGLTLGTSYAYSVTAYNGGTTGGGTSAASNALSKTPVASPNAPTNLSVTPGNQSLLVKWTKPTNLGGGSWDSYQIYIKPSADANFPSETVTAISNQNIESVTVTALASGAQLVNGVAYDVQIWAKTSANGASLSTNTVAVYLIPATVPAAPRFALSQTDTTTVTASWASNGDGGSALTGYTINLSSGACSFSFVSGTTSYSCAVTGLTAGTTVTASAIATNLMGNSASSTAASVTYISTVGAPTSLISADGNGQASISFAINTNGDTVVNYEYSTDGVSFEPLAGTTSPLTILGLTNGTTYNVSLRAKGSTYGIGATSSSVVVRPFVPAAVNTTPAIVNRSSFKVLTLPKISRSDAGFTCSAGTYQFIRSTGAVVVSNISAQIFNLIANGEVVESLASLMATAIFADRASFEGSTLYCQMLIKQEDVDEKFTSLDKVLIDDIDLAQTETLRMVNELFYSERDLAYLSRVQGNSASTVVWKKALEAASAKRLASIEKAKVDYISALESSGISVLKQEKVVVSKPEPVTEKPVEPSIKVPNVQPTIEMRKIGSIYFANGTYFINDASKRTLKALAAQIKSNGPKTVLSYGHTDQNGGVDNVLLSKNRSIAIAKYLKSLIPNQKIVTGWFASTKPVAKGKSTTDLAKNRRVEIYVK